MQNQSVILVGRNFGNILAMTRSLGEAGYGVEVLRLYRSKPSIAHPMAGMKPEASSKYVTRYEECIAGDSSKKAVDALTKFASNAGKKLVMPVDDYSIDLLDAHYDELRHNFLIPNIKEQPGAIVFHMDKSLQKKLAAEADLPVLPGATVVCKHGKFHLPEDVPFPCFVKPESSLPGAKTKMQRCDNLGNLQELLSKFATQSDFEILLESFADIQDEISILGVATANGVVSPGAFKVLMGGHKERKGVAVTGELVGVEELGDLVGKCNDFVTALGYVGIFDIDLIRTKDGGIYFEEINFRPGASTHALTKAGVNLAKMLADDMLKGEAIDLTATAKITGLRFVSEKVLLEEYSRGDVSRDEMRKLEESADIHFVRDEVDPAPYRDFSKYYSVAGALRLAGGLRGRR